MTRLLIALLLICSAVTLQAQDSEKVKDIRQLLEITGSGKLGIQIIQNIITTYKSSYTQVDSKFWEDFKNEITAADLVNMIVPIYDKFFTGEEIRSLISFYSSPVGKKIMDKLPALTEESMKVGRVWGQELADKIINRLKAKGYIKEG